MELPIIHTIKMVPDTTKTLTFSVTGLPSEITGVYFTVKKNFDQDGNTFQKTLNDGVSISGSKYIVRIAPSDTASLPSGDYVYDLKIVYGSDKSVLLGGPFELLRRVTGNVGS